MKLQIKAWGSSDVGLTRSHNEDSFKVDFENRLFLVADGMGGHQFGEVASQLAVRTVQDFVARPEHRYAAVAGGEEAATGLGGEAAQGGASASSDLLRDGFSLAHREVLSAVSRDSTLMGMGTTLVAILFAGATATVAHVGDSRSYLVRNRRLERLTRDHTWVDEQVVAGLLSEEQARSHPLKNVVTRALGGDGDLRVDIREVPVRAGDRFLLCSDGLTTMLLDGEIAESFAGATTLEEAGRSLIAGAQARGGYDDITVVVLEVEEGS